MHRKKLSWEVSKEKLSKTTSISSVFLILSSRKGKIRHRLLPYFRASMALKMQSNDIKSFSNFVRYFPNVSLRLCAQLLLKNFVDLCIHVILNAILDQRLFSINLDFHGYINIVHNPQQILRSTTMMWVTPISMVTTRRTKWIKYYFCKILRKHKHT